MPGNPSPPDPIRAEMDRLRQILWEIARMTGYQGPDEAPAGTDVTEIALDSVKAFCSEYLTYTGPQGTDINPAAGPDDRCSCGQAITWLRDRWLHLFNEALSAGRTHRAQPATGYYAPGTSIEPETIQTIRRLQERLARGPSPTPFPSIDEPNYPINPIN